MTLVRSAALLGWSPGDTSTQSHFLGSALVLGGELESDLDYFVRTVRWRTSNLDG